MYWAWLSQKMSIQTESGWRFKFVAHVKVCHSGATHVQTCSNLLLSHVILPEAPSLSFPLIVLLFPPLLFTPPPLPLKETRRQQHLALTCMHPIVSSSTDVGELCRVVHLSWLMWVRCTGNACRLCGAESWADGSEALGVPVQVGYFSHHPPQCGVGHPNPKVQAPFTPHIFYSFRMLIYFEKKTYIYL